MDTWRYTAIRITKYGYLQQTSNTNTIIAEEWTSYSDIGKKFNGIDLTLNEYLETEQRYIDAAALILNLNKGYQVIVRKLEKYSGEGAPGELLEMYEKISDNYTASLEMLPALMKLILRDYVWCELYCSVNDVCIRFGYDYYMYVNGVEENSFIWQEIIDRTGLFIG